MCYLGYSDYCPHLYCYIHNVSADMPSGLLQVLLVELGNLLFKLWNFLVVIGSFHGTSNWTLYLIQESSRVRKVSSQVRKVSSQVWQEAPEEGRRAYQPKRCEYNNKDEDSSPNNLDNTNNQASSQKFRKIRLHFLKFLILF